MSFFFSSDGLGRKDVGGFGFGVGSCVPLRCAAHGLDGMFLCMCCVVSLPPGLNPGLYNRSIGCRGGLD